MSVSRTLALGAAARADEAAEAAEARALRKSAVDELRRRRDEVGWAIEGDFDAYASRMERQSAWGGEIELLMLGHVLKDARIEVHMVTGDAAGDVDGLLDGKHATRVVARYAGDEGDACEASARVAVPVLFDGIGHYHALRANGPQARL